MRVSHRVSRRLGSSSAFCVAALLIAGCGRSSLTPQQSPVSPSASPNGGSVSAVGDTTNSTAVAGVLKICKLGNVSGTFSVSGSGPGSVISSPVTIANAVCQIVAENSDTTPLDVTVTETSAGLQSVTAVINSGGEVPFSNGGTLGINLFHGYTLTFTNDIPVHHPGNNGCTPGYWKATQHFDSWASAYKPGDSFNTTFGIATNWFPNSYTLLDALQAGGGGASALSRHATAALLNAAAGFYPLTTSQVISAVQAAYADPSLIESTKNQLDTYNNLGCPLN
jgi:hypothetical protein